MWNIAAQAGTGVAIAGLSATYYALIRKNLDMENRAMDDVAGDLPKVENIKDAAGDMNQSELKLPTTTSQNLLRKNFELLTKQSGRIYGINVAHSNELLVEKNHSESDLDHIVNRTEPFCTRSAVVVSGAQKSKSEFDVQKKFKYQNVASLDLAMSRSVFDVETFSSVEVSNESLSEEQRKDSSSMTLKICHCKYSASAEDISLHVSREHIQSENCIKNENIEAEADGSKEKSQIQLNPVYGRRSLTQRQMNGSLLSDDYIPRLENREVGAYNLFLPATIKRACPSQTKGGKSSAQVIFRPEKSKISKGNICEKESSLNTDNGPHDKENFEQFCKSFESDDFQPEDQLPSKVKAELERPVKVRYSEDFFRSTNKNLKSAEEYPSSSMLSLPDMNNFSSSLIQPLVEIKEMIANQNRITNIALKMNSSNQSMLVKATADTWQMVRQSFIAFFKTLVRAIRYALNIPIGAVVVLALAGITIAFVFQIMDKAGYFKQVSENPADSPIPEEEEISYWSSYFT